MDAHGVDIDQEWNFLLNDEFDPDEPREYLLSTIQERGSWTLVTCIGLERHFPRLDGTKIGRRRHHEALWGRRLTGNTAQMRTTLNDSYVFFVHKKKWTVES